MAPRRYFASHQPPAPPVSDEPLLKVADVRERLNLRTNAAVYWHIEKNGLPVRRIGRAIRVDRVELDAWARRHQQPVRPAVVFVRGA